MVYFCEGTKLYPKHDVPSRYWRGETRLGCTLVDIDLPQSLSLM
jgi:hypothetical protein